MAGALSVLRKTEIQRWSSSSLRTGSTCIMPPTRHSGRPQCPMYYDGGLCYGDWYHDLPEQPLLSIEGYLRRDDTSLAEILRVLSPLSGPAYLCSRAKRNLDLIIGLPVALMSAPLVALLIAMNRVLHPRQPALFIQQRVGPAGRPLTVVKIRSMGPSGWLGAYGHQVIPFRQVLRQYHLDELPQIWEVAVGRLTLVGIRVLPQRVYDELQRTWSPLRFTSWQRVYFTTPLGLTGVHQVFRGPGKEDAGRFHRDLFYVAHASLGFDMYLLWKTIRRIAATRVSPDHR